MSILKKFTILRKNKKYDYKPRYYDNKGKSYPYKIEHQLDQFRTTAEITRGLKGKLKNAMNDFRSKADRNLRMRMVIIISILVLIFLYIIDFDLSIFF